MNYTSQKDLEEIKTLLKHIKYALNAIGVFLLPVFYLSLKIAFNSN